MDMIMKNVKRGIDCRDCECCIGYINVKNYLYTPNVFAAIRITKQHLIKTKKRDYANYL